ncbi:uncharacterized protein DNG_09945 [Cephalotrichum gorgonifer]|uniref:Infection structure specific protein n=1 Tax=Cephalotrichum gorgonifer TaxID=2041049 RepID=A0AAE8N6P1_9PEZI|nr:uncharacterized protein DNG_09945 [Cephalotrichum gorgonifer]
MKTTLLSAALVGAASADLHIPADILHRDDNRHNLIQRADPTAVDTASCTSLSSAFDTALPKRPTIYAEFSSNYYKTVSRTATATEEDCAWITDLPESTYQEYREWNTEVKALREDPDNNARFQGIWEECRDVFEPSAAQCRTEWLAYVNGVIEDGGLFTDDDTTNTSPSPTDSPESTNAPESTGAPESTNAPGAGSESDDDGSAASTIAAQTYAAAALLAAFIGAVALL